MHEYVQKSTSTTLPRRPASVSGASPGVFSQWSMPANSGAVPYTGSFVAVAGCVTFSVPVVPLSAPRCARRVARLLRVLLERRRVRAETRLQRLVEVEDDRERRAAITTPSAGRHQRRVARMRRATRWPPIANSSSTVPAPAA